MKPKKANRPSQPGSESQAGMECIPRLIVKYFDSAAPREYADKVFEQDPSSRKVFQDFPKLKGGRLFSSTKAENLKLLVERALRQDPSYRPVNFFTYFQLDVLEKYNIAELVSLISSLPGIEHVYVAPPGREPCLESRLPNFPSSQEYFRPAPTGIDVKFAWEHCGMGAGQHFIDLERGWDFAHPDLDGHFDASYQPLTGNIRPGSQPHGTKVLGVICADGDQDPRTEQCIGIAPKLLRAETVSYWGNSTSLPAAILAAIDRLPFGGVLLLEAQLSPDEDNEADPSTSNPGLLPIEVQDATYQMIRLATALGIIVVEAAGNGGVNFDSLDIRDVPSAYHVTDLSMIKRDSPAFKDSGAIMVAAAFGKRRGNDEPRSPLQQSNFGTRIDLFAWGTDVTTLTSPQTSTNRGITNVFDGTSSASAIIAGAALAVQSVAESNLGIRLDGRQMRGLLRLQGTESDPRDSKIGVMPDLQKIVTSLLSLAPPATIFPTECAYFRDFDEDPGFPHESTNPIISPDILLPAQVTAGITFDFAVTVRNRGIEPAKNVNVKMYLVSMTEQALLAPANWRYLGCQTIPSVASAQTSAPVHCSGQWIGAPGTYFVIALIDRTNEASLPDYLPDNFSRPEVFFKFASRNIRVTCRPFVITTPGV